MSNFFRAAKRAADRLDKSTGFDAPYGTRPYQSIGDVVRETKNVLDALDEDASLAPPGSYAQRVARQETEDARWKMSAVERATFDAAEAYRRSLERALGRER